MQSKQTVPKQIYGSQAQLTLMTWCLLKYADAEYVAYEVDDDISVVLKTGKKILIQVKSGKTNPLTDRSLELWKTLYNWVNSCDPSRDEEFRILLTQNHPFGNLLTKILACQPSKDFADVHALLKTFQTSNKKIASLRLPIIFATSRLNHVFSNIIVEVTSDPHTHEAIREELRKYHETEHTLTSLYHSLISWVQMRIEQITLSGSKTIMISGKDFAEFHGTRRQELLSKVVYDLTPRNVTDQDKHELISSMFIRQLEEIGVDNRAKEAAITSYLRAEDYYDQLLFKGVIIKKDIDEERDDLTDYWENERICIIERSPELTGRKLFASCMKYRNSPLYTKLTKRELCQGTFHMLAEDITVWWHPNFKDKK